MRGEFIGVWSHLWDEVWMPLLADHEFPCKRRREIVALAGKIGR